MTLPCYRTTESGIYASRLHPRSAQHKAAPGSTGSNAMPPKGGRCARQSGNRKATRRRTEGDKSTWARAKPSSKLTCKLVGAGRLELPTPSPRDSSAPSGRHAHLPQQQVPLSRVSSLNFSRLGIALDGARADVVENVVKLPQGSTSEFSKLLNLKMRENGAHLRPSPFIPANVLSERLAASNAKQYSFVVRN
jgi:hypothetical protein